MTDRELMQQALEALEANLGNWAAKTKAITALRERLAQPEQELVAWGMRDMHGNIYDCISAKEHDRAEGQYTLPLYTAPQPRQWVGLTDAQIDAIVREAGKGSAIRRDGSTSHRIARAIEAKLKEKNNG